MRKLELVQPCDFTPAYGAPTALPHVLTCVGCGHTVHDLSSMTEAEALAFLDARAPGQCMRFKTIDERVLFRDGVGSVLGRLAENARPMIAVATLALAACGSPERSDPSAHAAAPERAPTADTSAPTAPTARESAQLEASATAPAAPSGVTSSFPPSGSAIASASAAPSTAPNARASTPPPKRPPTVVEMGGF